jgi:hypothetical protein
MNAFLSSEQVLISSFHHRLIPPLPRPVQNTTSSNQERRSVAVRQPEPVEESREGSLGEFQRNDQRHRRGNILLAPDIFSFLKSNPVLCLQPPVEPSRYKRER